MHSCSPSHKYEQLLLRPQRIVRPFELRVEYTTKATINETHTHSKVLTF